LSNEFTSEPNFVNGSGKNRAIIKDLIDEMSKPWSEMKITFSDVIARLEKLESSDDLYERKTRAATRVY
jgi:hypothetical protein